MEDEPTLTVRQLTEAVAGALAGAFPREVWVQGELYSLKRGANGHVYFQVIDPGPPGSPPLASLAVALFDSARREVNRTLRAVGGVRMTDGVQVRVRGRVEVYPAQGRLQLRMTAIDPTYTLGLLANERDRVLRTLAAEGLLARNKERTLPVGPLRVGLVTARRSAAMADFVHELEASGLRWQVVAVDARVQGTGAERSLLAALEVLERERVDVIAVVRGGGARTDLAAFDSEVLARAVAHAGVPVVTGIGHETDRAVLDEVAHTACKTPTACAAALVAHVRAGHEVAERRWRAVTERASEVVVHHERRVQLAGRTLTGVSRSGLALERGRLDDRSARTARAAQAALARAAARLTVAETRAAALDPARALARGWSITRDGEGRVVREAAALSPGTVLVTTLADGTVHSTVSAVDEPGAGA